MFLTDLFNLKKECRHDKITPDLEYGYCPDCGKLIYNDWYITRCACCGVKLRTVSRNGVIEPENNYCRNCGSSDFTIEKLPRINFIDINFAVLIKRIVVTSQKEHTVTQCWEEKTNKQPKLLGQYL